MALLLGSEEQAQNPGKALGGIVGKERSSGGGEDERHSGPHPGREFLRSLLERLPSLNLNPALSAAARNSCEELPVNLKLLLEKSISIRSSNLPPLTCLLLLWLATASGTAQVYSVLHTFGTNVMGLHPRSTLVQDAAGVLYGTTEFGGRVHRGQVFKVNPDGSGYAALKDFTGADGAFPRAGLALSGQILYGTTAQGGTNDYGTVFKLNCDGSGFAVLKDFGAGSDGPSPQGRLIISGSVLYGVTDGGGASGNGTVFKLNTNGGGFMVLKEFNVRDGANPIAGLVLTGMTLYGTTPIGGSSEYGTVFKLNVDGTGFFVLKEFNGSDGAYANGLALSGNTLFGTTSSGGGSDNGTIFKINTDGSGFGVLKDFSDPAAGRNPNAELLVSGTTLYGTAPFGGSNEDGTSFKLNTDGSGFAVLRNFTNQTDGAYSYAGLLLSGTTLYGTACNGGSNDYGTVFKMETDGSAYTAITHFTGGDGANPADPLTLSGTTLYGATQTGGRSGEGTIFKVNTDGSGYTRLKNFSGGDGSYPNGSLVLSGSALYGTTRHNHSSSGDGTVFTLNTDGSGYTVLRNFGGADGSEPAAGLILSGATLYGTAGSSGGQGGTVFKINTDGTGFAVLLHGPENRVVGPFGILLLSGSTLYGTSYMGGNYGRGTVFKVDTNGNGFAVLHSFNYPDGAEPEGGLVQSGTTLYGSTGFAPVLFSLTLDGTGFKILKRYVNDDGPFRDLVLAGATLYGTAWGPGNSQGSIFQVGTDGGNYTGLKYFTGDNGAYPMGGLVLSGTTLYGTTAQGGAVGQGVLFRLALLPSAPEIQLQPQSQSVHLGSSVNFLVGATGSPTPAYQWYFTGTGAIHGATNSDLQLDGIQSSKAGGYSVVVTNIYGSVTSQVATLAVEDPYLNGGPGSQWANAGETVRLSVDVEGTPPLSYQWFKDGGRLNDAGRISGAETTVLTLTNICGDDRGDYLIVVTNNFGAVTSEVATVFVVDPFLNGQPQSQSAGVGKTVALNVAAAGRPPLSYQWRRAGVDLADAGNVSGARTPTLTLSNLSAGDAAGYWAVVSNVYGSVTSEVATLSVLDPFILTPPVSQVVVAGQTVQFSVVAGGTPPLNYQWQLKETNLVESARIGGSRGATLTISDVRSSDAGYYRALVTSAYGTATSDEATLTVTNETLFALDIQAYIDGRDQLLIRSNTLQWFHYDNAVVGRWNGSNEPTIISTIAGAQTIMSNAAWVPTWPQPPPAEIRYPTNSSVFTSLIPGLPQVDGLIVSLTPIRVRGAATIVQLPSATNGFALLVEFDDNSAGATDWYRVRLDFSVPGPGTVAINPPSQTAEMGSEVWLSASTSAGSYPWWSYQWYANGGHLQYSTNSLLHLSNVGVEQGASYTVVLGGGFGAITSPPAMLSVIAPVQRWPVPGIGLIGQPGSLLHLECSGAVGPANWLPLDTVPLDNPPQVYLDRSFPLPPQRFYRAWQSAPAAPSSLRFPTMIPALTLSGSVGSKVRVDGINAIGLTGAWFTLATVTLTNTSQLYFDMTAPGQPTRLYRLVPVP